MKKSLIKVIIALIFFTVIIAITQNEITPYFSGSKSDRNWTGEEKHVENIIQKDEKSLNWWLSLYNSGYFKKVEVEDGVNLKVNNVPKAPRTSAIIIVIKNIIKI